MTPRPARDEPNLFAYFAARARERSAHVALRSRRAGSWEWTTWGDWFSAAGAVGAALIERGIGLGARVALMSTSREEWAFVDFGILGAGAVTVPIYPTATAEQAGFILKDSGATIVFVEGRRELDVARRALEFAPGVGEIVVIDASTRDVEPPTDWVGNAARVTRYVDLVQEGRDRNESPGGQALVGERSRQVTPESLASLVYTSGTTGSPRGVMLTHGNFAAELDAIHEAIPIGSDDEQLFMLPLAHILGRILVFGTVVSGSRLAFSAGAHRFVEDAGEVRPTFFAAVPRLFEKIHSVASESARTDGPLKAALFSWAVGVGRQGSRAKQRGKMLGGLSAARARYADALVLRRVRGIFGNRLRFAISGGAPLSRELAEWFHVCGILVLEGYGLTESTGASHVNREAKYTFGSVGAALPGVETRLGSDGEILLRSPTITRGYWNSKPGESPVDSDGFLHTGDIGRIDDGVLTIVDRKKDVIVTAGGSNVAPQHIETLLAASPWLGNAVVYGDRRPYLVALLTLDVAFCRRWARERKRPDDPKELAKDPELNALIQLDVDAVNRKLSSYETIKRFKILDHDFSVEAGELTDTLKVRRRIVHEKYRELLELLY